MPEGTPGGAPAPSASPAAASQTQNQPAGNSAPVKAADAPKDSKPESDWSDEHEKQFFELAKKAPWAKTKHKGEEKPIDSKESFLEVLNEAQRAKGASKLVEQAKKEREEAAKEREEAQRITKLVERARMGDEQARRALFGESPDETAQREAEWNKLTPEMRQLLVERQQMAEQLEEARSAQQRLLQEQQERIRVQRLEQSRNNAMKFADGMVPLLGIGPENAEAVVGVAQEALRSLEQEGFELADLTPALVHQRAAQMQEHLRADYFRKLPIETRLKLLGLEEFGDEQFEKVPDKWLTRAAKFKAARLDKLRRQPPQGQPPAENRQASTEEAPEVLHPWRWNRR